MTCVQSILGRKGREVFTIGSADTALAAAERMNQRAVGGLVVVEEGRVAGIVTERDILRRVVAAQRDPQRTAVRDILTSPVATCRPDTTLGECRAFMTEKRIRHLPVVDEHGLCGMITIGDLLAHEVGEHEATIEYLSAYIHGPRG
ncbi:MAG: CBS domain-containing protein [Candidatus Eisenbacteria bacterium]